MKQKLEIDSNPVVDSPNNDAFEGVVELYFQVKGYITSAGKWFWVWDKGKGKKQRGYQDIDVLAINGEETLIISVTSNLDDKINCNQKGEISKPKLQKLIESFERAEVYLRAVREYSWLVKRPRKLRYVLVYWGAKKKKEPIIDALSSEGVDSIGCEKIIHEIDSYLENNENKKIQNPMLRFMQVINSAYDED